MTAAIARRPRSRSPARRAPPAHPAAIDNPILVEHAEAIRKLGKQAVAEIGRRLTECKKIVGHGNWLPWLDREFGWSDRTALNFMRAYEMSTKSENFSDLSLPISGLYLLAAPSTPEEARDEIIERAKAGEKVSTGTIKKTIAKARNDPPEAFVEEEADDKEMQKRRQEFLRGAATALAYGQGYDGLVDTRVIRAAIGVRDALERFGSFTQEGGAGEGEGGNRGPGARGRHAATHERERDAGHAAVSGPQPEGGPMKAAKTLIVEQFDPGLSLGDTEGLLDYLRSPEYLARQELAKRLTLKARDLDTRWGPQAGNRVKRRGGGRLAKIIWCGRQWAATKYGVECRELFYAIPRARLWEDDEQHSWVMHMAEKTWVDLEDFAEALRVARICEMCRTGKRRW
jgi:hypothetical protein